LSDLHSPSGCFNPPDRSVQSASPQKAHLALRPIALCSPPRAFSSWLRINAPNPVSYRLANRSVNPGTESNHEPTARIRQIEIEGVRTSFLSFFRAIYQ
jgi:hypothetical protein